MSEYEQAHRLSAWTWAAETLGVEVTRERLANLVEVTEDVSLENLKLALEAVIKTEPKGFLPSPGAVISASNGIAGRKKSRPFMLSGGESDELHRKWMDDHNVERWTDEQWQTYTMLMNRNGSYAERVHAIIHERHLWAADQVDQSIGARKVSMGIRIQMRRDFNRDARVRFPAPDPVEEINREVEEAIRKADERRLAEEKRLAGLVPEPMPEVEEFEGPAFE